MLARISSKQLPLSFYTHISLRERAFGFRIVEQPKLLKVDERVASLPLQRRGRTFSRVHLHYTRRQQLNE